MRALRDTVTASSKVAPELGDYDFGGESVHIEIEPSNGWRHVTHVCKTCAKTLSQDHFVPVSYYRKIGSRAGRFKLFRALHPSCIACRQEAHAQLKLHELYSKELARNCTRLSVSARAGAVKRGMLFALDSDDVLAMFLKQNGRCALTDLPMDWEATATNSRSARNNKAPSIDRIDSKGNYAVGNVQLVLLVANIMKNDLPTDMFVALCRRVADHNLTLG